MIPARMLCLLGTLASLLALPAPALSQDSPSAKPSIEVIPDGRLRLSNILIDRQNHRFSVPGIMIKRHYLDDPLEFLVISGISSKGYESVIEVDASAVEFNIACILIGLDAPRRVLGDPLPPLPIPGPRVRMWVEWNEGDERKRVPVEELLQAGNMPINAQEWVYSGSFLTREGEFLAARTGILVGFSLELSSIIQHATGLGVGNWGHVTANPSAGPEGGMPVDFVLAAVVD